MRKTMVSLRGFQPPRSSTEGRPSPAPAPPAPPSAAAATSTRAAAGRSAEAKPRTSATTRGRAKAGQRPSGMSFGAGAAARMLGGHFSANRHLMEQVKETHARVGAGDVEGARQPRDVSDTATVLSTPPPQERDEPTPFSALELATEIDAEGQQQTQPQLHREDSCAKEWCATPDALPLPSSPLPAPCFMSGVKRLREAREEEHIAEEAMGGSPSLSAPSAWASVTPSTAAPGRCSSTASAAGVASAHHGEGLVVSGGTFLAAFAVAQRGGDSTLTGEGSGSLAVSQHGLASSGGSQPFPAPSTRPPSSPREESGPHDATACEHNSALFTAEQADVEHAESDEALAREVEEDLRMSEDLPFTPHRLIGGSEAAGSAPASQATSHALNITAPSQRHSSPRCEAGGTVSSSPGWPPWADAAPSLVAPTSLPSSTAPLAAPTPSRPAAGEGSSGPPPAAKKRTVFVLSTVSPTAPDAPLRCGAGGSAVGPCALEESPAPSMWAAAAAEAPVTPPTPPPAPLQLFLPQLPPPFDTGAAAAQKRTRFIFTTAVTSSSTAAPVGPSSSPPPVPDVPTADEREGTDLVRSPAASRDAVPPATAGPTEAPVTARSPSPPPPPPPVNHWYDLPPLVQMLFSSQRGIKALYEWQHNLLTQDAIRRGSNFVYSMPTSGGKTLVAEISLLRCVLNRGQSAFFVVPFVALAEEKTHALRPFGEVLDFAVEGHYGSTGRFPLPPCPAVFVCTMEKANSLLNHLLEEGREGELGAVVVDELHMLGEPRRGATLELFLSKLMLLSDRQRATAAAAPKEAAADVLSTEPAAPAARCVQVIGMSATIPNLHVIAEWLRAELYEGTERPVPLRQYSVVDGLVLRDGESNERNLRGRNEVDHLLELAYEVPEASVLIFCASRQQCVDTAKGLVLYAKRTAAANSPGLALTTAAEQVRAWSAVAEEERLSTDAMGALKPNVSAAVSALVDELQGLGSSSEVAVLAELVQFGVAFHHGGLLAEEREAIESAYRTRLVRILCCTSTLAAGVNLPARRVLFKTPYIGREFLTKARYLQMCGRAGRAGLDAYGESFLILARRDRDRGHRLMRQQIEPCLSQMLEEAGNLPRALLECVTVGLVTSRAAAVTGWGSRLLASAAQGPVDAVWEGPLQERFGPLYAASSGDSREGEGSNLGPCGLAGGGGDGSLSSPPPSMGGEPAAGVDTKLKAAEADSGGGTPLRRAAYLAELQRTQPPADILAALLEHSLTVLVDSGLVAQEEATTAPPAEEQPRACEEGEKDEEAEGRPSTPPSPPPGPRVRPTPFGASAVRSCFSVEEALLVRDELQHLRHTGLILGDDLHLCYFLTPLREVGDCDWATYAYLFAHLSDSQQHIAHMLGVSEQFIAMRAMGLGGGRTANEVPATAEGKRDFFTARRFYVALMLADVLSEVPMEEVEARYNVRRGQLQSLMRSAAMFSSSITSFCHAMEWFSLEAVLASFVKRLGFGVKPDLVPLMEIRNVQPGRARALWNAGFKSPKLIAACEDADEMVTKVKASNTPDSRAAKFFTRRAALAVIREATILLDHQIKEKRDELQLLTGTRL